MRLAGPVKIVALSVDCEGVRLSIDRTAYGSSLRNRSIKTNRGGGYSDEIPPRQFVVIRRHAR